MLQMVCIAADRNNVNITIMLSNFLSSIAVECSITASILRSQVMLITWLSDPERSGFDSPHSSYIFAQTLSIIRRFKKIFLRSLKVILSFRP